MNSFPNPKSSISRRRFLQTGSSALAGATLLGSLPAATSVHPAGNDLIKIALVGCGGRGSGAANQALKAAGNAKLVALADLLPEKLGQSLASLQGQHPDKVNVPPDQQFTDFDGYKKAIALADVVILATSPGFRPIHFEEAVRQSKHVFMEKPVATDAPGIRQLLAAAEEAKKKNLKVGVGFQRHHQRGYLETVKRLHDGALGDIMSLRCYWDGDSRDGVERLPGETEMHYQIRNWYYFTWLSGDHIVEQHCHNIDVCNWIKGAHPVRAQGMGGRQVRNARRHGQIFDHHFVEFEYADGVRMLSQCRQIPGCWTSVSEHVLGTKGSADLIAGRNLFAIKGAESWRYNAKDARKDAYQQEHEDLFDAIRNDKPFNEAEWAGISTMTAILGRMCTYSGQQIEWDAALNSKIELLPKTFGWDVPPPVLPDADGFYPVAMPGQTVVV
ncbi:MAG TPA: Gfo/Idh/MocA family oxidoreductase [Candidatus Paceibacterota bacterium]|nr:Gfo/Idh/MocA family oxidoreductase [Verrucomicrobiota bacterium]HSA10066.1 Gfo/Idh/MocA family oxidoreductase [Candidatus Paceibacterota bacterium]